MTAQVAFLWHMHQPYYRNMHTKASTLPWVRLHGIRAYYDMLRLYSERPNTFATINFVPSLIEQLLEYTEKDGTDDFLNVTRTPAADLTQGQKTFILHNFFMASYDKMIKPIGRYWNLLQKRGLNLAEIDMLETTRFFSTQDYLDIQLYYNLVWFGFKAREDYPELRHLFEKGRHFSEEDKGLVIKIQFEVLKKVAEMLKDPPSNVEISTTPYYHTILPLLIDTNIASRMMPHTPLPTRVALPKFAAYQVSHAAEYVRELTGRKEIGMWPAEGSVAPEVIPLFANAGVSWIATDEGNLERSLPSYNKARDLYEPYIAEFEGAELPIVFRDRELADLLGFSYQKTSAEIAVNDFCYRINAISNQAETKNPLITVALDGENPWEYYDESGKFFLNGLFDRFATDGIKTTTIGKFIAENPPTKRIKNLNSGSWINSNFHIWIGKPQKNKGWDYVRQTFTDLGKAISENPQAMESFCAACGSDWFWWFDDDFHSEFKSDFDKIFRMHLKNVYTFLGRDVPPFLFQPIYRYEGARGMTTPKGFISPTIDGKLTSFYEWINAAGMEIGKHLGTMGRSKEFIESIYFGYNADNLYLRIDPMVKEHGFYLKDTESLIFQIHDNDKKFKIKLARNGTKYRCDFVEDTENGFKLPSGNLKWAAGAILEMEIPFAILGVKEGEKLTVILSMHDNDIEIRHYSHINFSVPERSFEEKMWSV